MTTILGIRLRSDTKPADPSAPPSTNQEAPEKPESFWTVLKRFFFPSKAIKFCRSQKGKELSDPNNPQLKGFLTASFTDREQIRNKCQFKTGELTLELVDPDDFPAEDVPGDQYEKAVFQKLLEKANAALNRLDANLVEAAPTATAASAAAFCAGHVGKSIQGTLDTPHGVKGFETAVFNVTGNTTDACKIKAGSTEFDFQYVLFPIDEASKTVNVKALIQKLIEEASGARVDHSAEFSPNDAGVEPAKKPAAAVEGEAAEGKAGEAKDPAHAEKEKQKTGEKEKEKTEEKQAKEEKEKEAKEEPEEEKKPQEDTEAPPKEPAEGDEASKEEKKGGKEGKEHGKENKKEHDTKDHGKKA